MVKGTKVIDQNFICEEFENRLNWVMTVKDQFKIYLVCYLETLTLKWNIQSYKFSFRWSCERVGLRLNGM